MDLFHLILAVLPFIVFSLLLIFHHKASLLKISLITLVVNTIIAIIFWQTSILTISSSTIKGFFIALDIFFIIFGAIFFLEILKSNKTIDNLSLYLDHFSPDFRIQVVILAWFFECFLEGIAGFGTPCIVVAPLLVALGISPLKAIVISLLGNSTSVPFGAVGTPIRVGFAGINVDLLSVGSLSSIYNFVGILVPVFMIWVLVSSEKNRKSLFLKSLPFAIWSGIAFVFPSFLVSLFGIEFPAILGSVLGLILIMFTSHFGFLVPDQLYKSSKKITEKINLTLFQTIFPYLLFIILLIISKIFLSPIKIQIPYISHSISLFNPGFVFVFSGIIMAIILKINLKNLISIVVMALKKSIEPFLVVAAMSTVVQIMNNSSNPALNLPSITKTISYLFDTKLLPFIAPFVGAFGSFITGSATVSDIMFGNPIYSSSISQNLNPIKILSLLVVGAGAGNMIAIADVLAAKTIAGGNDSLRKIVFNLFPYCLTYLIIVGILGILI